MLSTPTPARAIALSLSGFASTLAVTFAPERTISASYSPTRGGQLVFLQADLRVELDARLLEILQPLFGQLVGHRISYGHCSRSFVLEKRWIVRIDRKKPLPAGLARGLVCRGRIGAAAAASPRDG